jgi:protein-disulfide isomerase
MSSRREQREHARAERQAAEQAEAAQAARRKRLLQLGGILGVVVIGVVIAVVVASGGSDKGGGGTEGAKTTASLFAGIPQQGQTLGNANAPVTMQEFADLQCPFCREYTLNVLPDLIPRYVSTGKVKMVFRPLVFLGEDSEPAARATLAAGKQNLSWQYADAFYRNQEQENSGYVTDDFLRKIGKLVPGLDVEKMMSDMNAADVTRALARDDALSRRLKVEGTPTFFLNRKGATPVQVPVSQLETGEFTSAIDAALQQG